MQILVIGAAQIGARGRARAGGFAGHDVVVAEQASGIAAAFLAQQRGDPAGMYYPTGSLRAIHSAPPPGPPPAVRLLRPARRRAPQVRQLISKRPTRASKAQVALIERRAGQRRRGLTMLDGPGRAAARAGAVVQKNRRRCIPAETGIIDGHAFMLALQGDLKDRGGMIAFATPIEKLPTTARGWAAQFRRAGAGPARDRRRGERRPGSCAGAGTGNRGLSHARVPPALFAKGNYFYLFGPSGVFAAVYPTPVDGGLGIHVTLDLSGRMRFGPDVEWVDREFYDVDPFRGRAVRGSHSQLLAGPAGKRAGAGLFRHSPQADRSRGERTISSSTVPRPRSAGLVHLFGIESPGLTSALSLARRSSAQLEA